MKVREYRLEVWDRMGTQVMHTLTRDRNMLMVELERQSGRTDLDVASIKVSIQVADNVEQEIST